MMTLKMKLTQHLMFSKKFMVFKQAEHMSVESPLFSAPTHPCPYDGLFYKFSDMLLTDCTGEMHSTFL